MNKNSLVILILLIVIGACVSFRSNMFVSDQSASSLRSNVEVPLGAKSSNAKPSTPQIFTLPPQSVSATGATLFGTIISNGVPTNVWFFVFNSQPALVMQTPSVLINNTGAISTPVTYQISGLTPATTYMYEMCASISSGGFTCSHIERFTTPSIINPNDPIYTN